MNNKIKECNTFFSRLIGLSFRKKINQILIFPNCNSIHTFFMFSKIDVIMTDKNKNILYIYKNLKSNKIIWPKKDVYFVYEFPPMSTNYNINDKLKI